MNFVISFRMGALSGTSRSITWRYLSKALEEQMGAKYPEKFYRKNQVEKPHFLVSEKLIKLV
jgi:hypothetical protein